MNDIAQCEQRLSTALDRIDYGIDRLRAALRPAPEPAAAAPGAPATPEPGDTAGDLADLHRRQEAALARAQARLVAAGAEAARLAAANDALIAANRALIAAQERPDSGDSARRALEAEVDALQAARSAEIAQMGDILAALEAMLGIEAPTETPAETPAEAGAAPAAGYDPDAEALPPEGRILRFGRDGTAEDGDEADADGDGDSDREGA